MTNFYEDDLTTESTTSAFVYADSAVRHEIQLPLALSWHTQSGVMAEDLYNDDDTRYVTYASGINQTIISSRTKDRFGSMSIELVEGSFSGFIQAFDESLWDSNPPAVAGPYITSGDASGDTLFIASYYEDTPESPQYITFSGTGSYNVIFPKPIISRSFKLIHSGSAPYKISRVIPRRAIQSFDLEVNAIKAYHVSASLIETIALEVSDSIVVGPDLIGDKTLTGAKIVDGTVSGVLITPGTITGNLVQAGTISGVLITGGTITADRIATKTLTAGQIADATITGSLIQAGTVSGVLITDNAISASKIQANTITGDKIAAATISGTLITAGTITGEKIAATTISGSLITAGAITSDKINVTNLSAVNANTGNLSVNGTLTVTSGQIVAGKTRISSTGIDIVSASGVSDIDSLRIMGSANTGKLEGLAFYNTFFSSTTPMASLSTNWNNVFGIDMPYDLSPSGSSAFQITFNATSGGQVKILNGGLDLVRGDFFVYDSTGTSIVSSLNNSGVFQVSNGSITTPALSFRNDTDTGFYKVEPNAIRLSCGGVWSAYFDATRTMIPDGTVGTPGLSFINDQDTGFYKAEADAIRISTGNNFTGLFSTNQLQMASGTETLPSYTFVNDNDTGMFRSAANSVALTAGGNQILTAASAGQVLISTANSNGQLTIEVPNGTARTLTTWRQLNDASAYINFVSNTVTASTPIQTSALGAYAGKVRVQVNGVVRWIPFYQ